MFTSVRSRRTAARLTVGLGLALASAGCGGGGGGGGATPTGPNPPGQPNQSAQPVTAATVTMRTVSDGYSEDENRFSPAQVSLKKGGTVTWSNETGVAHNVTFAATDGAPANVATHSSGSTTRTFGSVGAFSYQCTNHAGMSGTVTVVE